MCVWSVVSVLSVVLLVAIAVLFVDSGGTERTREPSKRGRTELLIYTETRAMLHASHRKELTALCRQSRKSRVHHNINHVCMCQ